MVRQVALKDLVKSSGVGFGTSGARGLVSSMSDEVCATYAMAFLQALERRGEITKGTPIGIAGDRRPSTARILSAVAYGILQAGYRILNAGRVPSPALALLGLEAGIPTMMVTGSHIPDDRNGIKFNHTKGEILKPDEEAILAETVELPDAFDASGALRNAEELPAVDPTAESRYVKRYFDGFPRDLLAGKRVVVYGHSAVGRELMVEILGGLGADVVRVAWSENFIPVDTEAIRPQDVSSAVEWAAQHHPFAMVSTDGDSDRPLVSDEDGRWLRGDVLGVLTARFLGADAVVTPVSSNTVVERSRAFQVVARTKIGSPHVIEQMLACVGQGHRRVVGYEANGGFLTATELTVPRGGRLAPLPTRDPIVVMLSVLGAAAQSGRKVSELLNDLPPRVTASGRLQDFSNAISRPRLAELATGGVGAMDALLGDAVGQFAAVDTTDGVRGTTKNDEIVHLRASGNAPELRCYAEASNPERATELTETALAAVKRAWS